MKNFVWRFYMDPEHRWRWQRLSSDRSVLSESLAGYKEYAGCLANAKGEGYVFYPPQAKLLRANAR
jgi:hypothetical protein